MPKLQNDFWNEQRKGTNFMNSTSLPENYEEANEFNIEFIRLAPDKWAKERDFLFDDKPDANSNKDFLIGNADQYEGIVENDFKMLKEDLDAAYARESKVVLTVLSLPGNRWRQFNNYENDDRIWQDFKYHEQAALFWKDLAVRLKEHPAVVGYNVINEPHPETATGFNNFWTEDYDRWYNKVETTPADLNRLYGTIVDSIRSVDADTPIILDSGLFATPWAINYLKPIEDNNVLYVFHMYEPYEMTSQNRKKGFTYTYPGKVKVGNDQKEKIFDKTSLKDFLEPVAEWAEKHNIPNNRIIAEEFGINRMVDGADQYIKDLIDIFNDYGWHWAFYAFREDTWDGMDFELGNKPVKEAYWDAQANGELPDRKAIEVDNSIWDVLKKDLNK
ncbi:glycoside hydrolase family 5 protein [Lysinibacillus fusiformis]|uniref:glycoside hydrolase family 5 protein n=1 Tax=Lysinibacillus fusiformis TaxID=28031 RepID=UPI00215AA90C|nr:glycoside hydrolase family 5 protein [Lysinibacillus fusiformis]MCR8851844.1 glycoside hydrolase family 5 protein [Lysinibacillus fusiformis]WKT79587.1 glycoside hydrolase family 5 protein [Lysinibacillus fusiformis]